MDMLEVIRNRVSVRKFKSRRVDELTFFEILDAGRYAPAAGNLQNWRFLILDEKEKIQKVGRATLEPEIFANVSYVVVVCSEQKELETQFQQKGKIYAVQNIAAAIENILIAAASKGVDTLWIGSFADEIVKTTLSIPEDVDIHAILLFGYRDGVAKHPAKKDLAHCTFFNKWGEKSNQKAFWPISQHIESAQKAAKETSTRAGVALKKAGHKIAKAGKKFGKFVKAKVGKKK